MSHIKKLPQNVINQIAAGEVVERPASVVKELIENSIDAKSTRIIVKVENAGKKSIEIIDNGVGMDKDNAKMAFEQHATSKISDISDLQSINTMGFRGEALASISSVSKVSLYTKKKDSVGKGVKVVTEAEKISLSEDSGVEEGVRIKVDNLFENIPARKKFLKSDTTEFKQITETFLQLALSRPEIHFELIHNDKEVYNLPQTTDSLSRVFDIFGEKIASKLIEINYNSPDITITGFIGRPDVSQNHRTKQYIFLNGRPIQEKTVSQAVYKAFHTVIPRDQHPIFFLSININPEKIDVNVHPRKQEVKFEDTQLIFMSVKRAVESSLQGSLQTQMRERLETSRDDTISKLQPQKHNSSFTANPGHEQNLSFGTQNRPSISQSLRFSKDLLEGTDETQVHDDIGTSGEFIQIFNTYLLITRGEKLLVIDQHAAAERIAYEKLMEGFEKGSSLNKQDLLTPINMELSENQIKVLTENIESIRSFGFEIEEFGGNSYNISSIPAIFQGKDIEKLIVETLELLADEVKESTPIDEVIHSIASSMACHGSIRAGMRLSREQVEHIVDDLLETKEPYSCPHGRPIIWEITKYEMEKNFKRVK